ncbi:MAG: hypothetical protein K0U61_02590 [Alphaproteobacteria bacterium]|nr:hypothetical protein [Alphaproteobacteria bacterium]
MTKAVKVKQPAPPAEEVPTEVLAEAICAVADAADKLMTGRLNAKAVILLIQHACPSADRPTQKQIEMVLHAARSLRIEYVRPRR